MKLHRRLYLPLALAVTSLLALCWLWQMTLPLLDAQADALHSRRVELQQRQQAASAEIYQSLIARLQHPLPEPAVIIAALRKAGTALNLPDASYALTQPQPLERNGVALVQRRLSISLPKAGPAAALALWQELRQALSCEVRLGTFTSEGPQSRLEVELIGTTP